MSAQSPFRNRNGPAFELIETLRWEPDSGFVRLERHIARLASSARQLGFLFSRPALDDRLKTVTSAGPLRVRMTLSRGGQFAVATQQFQPLPKGAVWRLAVAQTHLDAADPLIRHKTTRREVYEAARAEYGQEEAHEVLLLNKEGQVCEGTITNIFVEDERGWLLTPALSCGLLPGIFRAELLAAGQATEAELKVEDLLSAKAVHVGNSLRELISAELLYPR